MKLPPVFLLPALFALTALASTHCRAAAETNPLVHDPVSTLGQMLFGIVIVFGVLAGCVWLLKRFSSPVRGNGLLRILGVTAVGPREKVVLLEVGEKVLMLGVTPNNVRTLHVFEHGELPLVSVSDTTSTNPGSSFAGTGTTITTTFANRLTQALKGRCNVG
jgi:flagellar protein FliO/FliZ